jgi:hypothetical protein
MIQMIGGMIPEFFSLLLREPEEVFFGILPSGKIPRSWYSVVFEWTQFVSEEAFSGILPSG